jgi:ABC-type sugar transport system substrate-binding protein
VRPKGKRVLEIGALAGGVAMLAAAAIATAATTGATSSSGLAAKAPGQGTPVPALGIGSPTKRICAGKTYTIGYDVFSDTEATAALVTKTMKQLAKRLGCVEVISFVDKLDPATVLNNAKIMVQRGVDGAVLFNVVQAAGPPAFKELTRAGIPYVSIAVTATPADVKANRGRTFVVDDYAAGYQAGEALAKVALKRFGSGDFPYVLIGRFDAVPSGKIRLDGSEDAIKKVLKGIPGDRILRIETKADPANSSARTLDVLSRVPEGSKILITGINDDNVFAMFKAAKQRGWKDGDLLVVTQGAANPSGLKQMCQNPSYAGGVAFFPERYVEYALPAAIALVNGKKGVPNPVMSPTRYVPTSHVKRYYPKFKC